LTISSLVVLRSGTSNVSRSGRFMLSAIALVDIGAFQEGEMQRDRVLDSETVTGTP
jgi:hypothetical protein